MIGCTESKSPNRKRVVDLPHRFDGILRQVLVADIDQSAMDRFSFAARETRRTCVESIRPRSLPVPRDWVAGATAPRPIRATDDRWTGTVRGDHG